jgi:hypothetical protein
MSEIFIWISVLLSLLPHLKERVSIIDPHTRGAFMQNHLVQSDHVFHNIPDMTETPLRKLVLCIASTRLATAEEAKAITAAAEPTPEADSIAIKVLSKMFTAPRNNPDYIQGLQYLGSAFTQAYKLDTPAPEGLTQSQWNRALRDQGERLRSASLTLGAGRETIAAEQLEALSIFIEKHFSDFAA